MKSAFRFACLLSCVATVVAFGCTAEIPGNDSEEEAPGGDLFGSGGTSNSERDDDLVDIPAPQGTGGTIILGPETEATAFRSPVVTGDYLWAPNSQSGKVALIHAPTLSVRVLSAGLQPTTLAAVSGDDVDAAAIVINEGTSDASYFEVDGADVRAVRIPLHVGANQWAISESGRYAVAWSAHPMGELDPTEGLQEISVIDLSDDSPGARRLGIGLRPMQITFDEAEQIAIIVAERGISLVTLETGEMEWIQLDGAAQRDVSITRDGRHALVREPGREEVEVVSLDGTEVRLAVELPGAPTDLDLSPTGRAVAVLREQEMMATFVVDDILDDPAAYETVSIPGQIIGSAELTEDGQIAVLYTNAADSGQVTVVRLGEGEDFLSFSTFDTQASVESVAVSPDGAHAIVRAKSLEGSSSGAFTVLTLSEHRFPRVLGTAAPIAHVDLHDDFGLVTASSASVHEAHLVSLAALQVDVIPLASAPTSAGILPELGVGFAAQNHSGGRVTFFDFEKLEARTLTGFELSSEAVQE